MGQGGLKSGNYFASKANRWKAYDSLPPSVRLALQQAAFDWAAYPIWRQFNSGNISAKELVKSIRKWDADQIRINAKKIQR